MEESELKDEVLELTLACQRDDASAEERARLERLLADEPQAIAWYLRVVDDTVTLRAAAAREASPENSHGDCPLMAPGFFEEIQREATNSTPPKPPASEHTNRMRLFWAALAVVLLLSASAPLWWSGPNSAVGATAGGVDTISATVVNVSNVRWAEGAKQFKDWSYVEPGDVLQFHTGLVNLFLPNGAEVLIEGPADVTFESLEKVFARQGKLAARVGPGAIGFRIETPHANVIDRGTAFGLSVDERCRTSVVVYEGMVDLDVLGNTNQPRRRLATGEGLTVNKHGELSRITTVGGADFLAPPQARPSDGLRGRVITTVSDNVRSMETAKYYRVMPGSFREDCQAYVDRDHEWNGADDRGLPPFLVGGDYVMTYNDDKITTGIEIAVSLARRASLYVIIDDRVPPPEWLKRDFVDTTWDVGSDDGWDEGAIVNGIGAGESIDHTCSVWRRDVPEPSTVVLGALTQEQASVPPSEIERSMYGIVATSLDRAP